MNAKQIIPVVAKIAPPALLGVAIYYGLKWLFSADNPEKKPETAPTDAGVEHRRKETETVAFRLIPAEIPAKPAAAPVPAVIPPFSVPVQVPQKTAPQIPLPAQKKFIAREDLANIFQRGARALTRTAAVAALKNLGFGKTAAYDALSPDGRFSAWLQCAPDGIITWKS